MTQARSEEFGRLVGRSEKMKRLRASIRKAAKVPLPVLIVGETGTGKELVAREIHDHSSRKDGVFLPVHTGTMSRELVASELFGHRKGAFTGATEEKRGCFEDARGGTLFLDEISTMDESVQVALLRVLETGKYRPVGGTREKVADVRILAATSSPPIAAVERGEFRSDLLHRLQVLKVELPALRNNREDIALLAEHFLAEFCLSFHFEMAGISEQVHELLQQYDWPGNIRELRNVVAQAAVSAEHGTILPEHLPPRLRHKGAHDESEPADLPEPPSGSGEQTAELGDVPCDTNAADGRCGVFLPIELTLDDAQREFVHCTLRFCENNKTKAARLLGISRKALYDKLARWEKAEALSE